MRSGAPTPLIRFTGQNPHATVAPLRHAMYRRLGITGTVREEWPSWDLHNKSVVWESREISLSDDGIEVASESESRREDDCSNIVPTPVGE